MKSKKELDEIKEEVEKLDTKLHELTEEELEQVTGGGPRRGVVDTKFVLDEVVGGKCVVVDDVAIDALGADTAAWK